MPTAATRFAFADLAALEAHLAAMARVRGEMDGLSELDHGLQCAAQLRIAAPDDAELQVAGLVHDVAHGEALAEDHAELAARAVAPLLGERVAALVRHHVPAKRYLVATDPAVQATLSPVSVLSLARQGGPMTPAECAAYEREPHWQDGLTLRRADDAAKVPGKPVPGLEEWLPVLRRVASLRCGAAPA